MSIEQKSQLVEANQASAGKMTLVVIAMFGFGFALVPLYDVICDITGLNGKTGVIDASQNADRFVPDTTREVKVDFITSVNEFAPIAFKADMSKMEVNPGGVYEATFVARNLSDKFMVGQAVPSVSPREASLYFNKVECFCFENQPFEAGEEKIMPVKFVVDKAMPAKYKSVVLSYTFFDVSDKAALSNKSEENNGS